MRKTQTCRWLYPLGRRRDSPRASRVLRGAQHHPGLARPQNHARNPGRSRKSKEAQDRLPRSIHGEMLRRFVALKEVDFHAAASAGATARTLRSIASDDKAVQAGKRLRVVGKG